VLAGKVRGPDVLGPRKHFRLTHNPNPSAFLYWVFLMFLSFLSCVIIYAISDEWKERYVNPVCQLVWSTHQHSLKLALFFHLSERKWQVQTTTRHDPYTIYRRLTTFHFSTLGYRCMECRKVRDSSSFFVSSTRRYVLN
jgi:hypothetical protein